MYVGNKSNMKGHFFSICGGYLIKPKKWIQIYPLIQMILKTNIQL